MDQDIKLNYPNKYIDKLRSEGFSDESILKFLTYALDYEYIAKLLRFWVSGPVDEDIRNEIIQELKSIDKVGIEIKGGSL